MEQARLTLSIKEAAQMVGVSDKTLSKVLEEDETFPAFRLTPGKTIIPLDGLREWAKEKGRARAGIPPIPKTIRAVRAIRKKNA